MKSEAIFQQMKERRARRFLPISRVDIHRSINVKSWDIDGINTMCVVKWFYWGQKSYSVNSLISSEYPRPGFGLYHTHSGKRHSQYPR